MDRTHENRTSEVLRAAAAYGVDLSLLAANLALTPTEESRSLRDGSRWRRSSAEPWLSAQQLTNHGAAIPVELFGRTLAVLDLPGLIRAKNAAARPKDLAHVRELEALLAIRGS